MRKLWNKRGSPRIVILRKVRARVGPLEMDVCIRDVSSSGMLLQANSPPPPGQTVTIFDAAFSITGRVVWSSGRRFGIVLDESFRIDLLRPPETEPLDLPAFAPRAQSGRPGIAALRLTAEERQRVHNWSSGSDRSR
jgi:hypothetical protein